MQKLCYLSYVLLLTFSPMTLAMIPPSLNNIEFEIFKREVEKNGIDIITQQIAQTPNSTPINDRIRCGITTPICLTVESKFFLTDTNDPLANIIFETIAKKEAKNGYLPKQIIKDDNFGHHVTPANNKLGIYTTYEHKADDTGEYIACKSIFNNKKVLTTALIQIKNDNAEQNGPDQICSIF